MHLSKIIEYLETTFNVGKVQDFPNAFNGLQLANNGSVRKIIGTVDASRISIEKAVKEQAQLLIVHHGLLWSGAQPIIGPVYELYKKAMDANLAIYSMHLPLDIHPQWSHNATIAKRLNLTPEGHFAHYKEQACGLVCSDLAETLSLEERLQMLFPHSLHTLRFGLKKPKRIGIVSGSGGMDILLDALKHSIDTVITGELRYSAVSFAQLHSLNVFACGHYATECFGIQNILSLIQKNFQIPCSFIDTFCEL